MTEHDYIFLAYGFTGLCLAIMTAWTIHAARATVRRLARLQRENMADDA